jgi:hypothetical protein
MKPKLFASLCFNGATPAKVGEKLQHFEGEILSLCMMKIIILK